MSQRLSAIILTVFLATSAVFAADAVRVPANTNIERGQITRIIGRSYEVGLVETLKGTVDSRDIRWLEACQQYLANFFLCQHFFQHQND